MGLIGRILCVTAVAVALALAVVTVSLVGSAAAERDVMVRRGRSTSHRLDSIDGMAHAHEVSEPDTAPAGLTFGGTAATSPATPRVDSPPALVAAGAVIGRPDVGSLQHARTASGAPPTIGVRPTPGRAPPIA